MITAYHYCHSLLQDKVISVARLLLQWLNQEHKQG